MSASETKKTDKQGYNDLYRGRNLELAPTKEAYVRTFEKSLQPFYLGGPTKGYVRKVATDLLFQEIRTSLKQGNQVTVLDAGCGLGQLAIYLACKGCNVVGIDISEEGCAVARSAAEDLNLTDNCTFHAVSLEDIPLPDSSVDYIIGHASLHHFIKYEAVPSEFSRILKPNGQGFFADAFGENPVYKIFHNRKKMEQLGDVSLNKNMIQEYFHAFDVDVIPTDWFVMLDKLYLRIFPSSVENMIRSFSRAHFWLDRKISVTSSLALRLSGSVVTRIRKG